MKYMGSNRKSTIVSMKYMGSNRKSTIVSMKYMGGGCSLPHSFKI